MLLVWWYRLPSATRADTKAVFHRPSLHKLQSIAIELSDQQASDSVTFLGDHVVPRSDNMPAPSLPLAEYPSGSTLH